MSNCNRPERGLEYRQDSSKQALPHEEPDPFGINPDAIKPINK